MPLGPNNVELTSGTDSVTPLKFAAGTNNTTPADGGMEYDGNCFYQSNASSFRMLNVGSHVQTITTSYAISTDSTGNQKLINGSTNGAVNVGPNRSYLFEAGFEITNLSTVSGTVGFSPLGGGTATVSHQAWHCMSMARVAASSVPTACNISYHRAASTACIAAASTLGQVTAFIKGKLVVTTSGTLIPSVFYGSSGVTGAPTVSQGAYFTLTPIGSNTVNTIGPWT